MGKVNYSISQLIILVIKGYQYLLSSLIGHCCRFYPSCSSYAIEAIQSHGYLHGSYLAVRRISRCHPWHEGGMDPVPEKKQDAN